MRQVTIKGSIVVENQQINESFFDSFFSNLASGGFFGNLMSGILGDSKGDKGPQLSKYEQARQDMIKKFKEQRETEIKNAAKHKDEMKASQHKLVKMQELNQKKAEEAKREQERKAEREAIAAQIKELETIGKKIDKLGSMSGPTSKDELDYLQEVSRKIGKSLPEYAQIAENTGVIMQTYYLDENGNFDPKGAETRMEKEFGGDWKETLVKNNPDIAAEIKKAEEKVAKFNDMTDDEKKDWEKKELKNISKMAGAVAQIRTPEEIKKDQELVDAMERGMREKERAVGDADAKVKDLKAREKDVNKKAEDAEAKLKEKQGILDRAKEQQPIFNEIKDIDLSKEDGKQKLATKLHEMTQQGSEGDLDGLWSNPDPDKGETEPTLNKDSKQYKTLIQLGFKEDQIKEICKGDGSPTEKQLQTLVDQNPKIAGRIQQKAKDYDNVITNLEKDVENAENINTEAQNAKEKWTSDLGEAEKDLEEENNKEVVPLDENGDKIKNEDGTDVTSVQINQAMGGDPYHVGPYTSTEIAERKESLNKETEEREKYSEELKQKQAQVREANRSQKAKKDFEKNAKEHPELKLDEIQPQSPAIKHDEEGDYVEIPNENGKLVPIRKPKPGAPAEEIERWDTAVTNKNASIVVPDSAPEAPTDQDWEDLNDPDKKAAAEEKIKAYKQYEVNKKAREQARAKMTQDERDQLDDRDFLDAAREKDENYKKAKDKVQKAKDALKENPEDENLKKSLEDAEKELEDAENNLFDGYVDDVEAEDADLEDEQSDKDADKAEQDRIDQMADGEDKEKAQAALDKKKEERQNPAKIWKRRKKKDGSGTTKSYYYVGKDAKRRRSNESIPASKYQEMMTKWKAKKAKKAKGSTDTKTTTNTNTDTTTTQDGASRIDNRPVIFEHRAFTFIPIGKVKK